MRRRRRLAALAAATAVGAACAATVVAIPATAASTTSTLKGSAPVWANSKNLVGATDPTTDIGFRVYLGWNNASTLQTLVDSVSSRSPRSSSG
jgi:hypothetical protein